MTELTSVLETRNYINAPIEQPRSALEEIVEVDLDELKDELKQA